MSSSNAIKVAVLGSGQMGENVVRHLGDSPLVRNITVFDRHPERMEALKHRHRVGTADSLERVLQDPDIRLVFITASNNAHKELAIAALEAGKAVMCEKPMVSVFGSIQFPYQHVYNLRPLWINYCLFSIFVSFWSLRTVSARLRQ